MCTFAALKKLNMDTQTISPPIERTFLDLPAERQREELERCGVKFDEYGQPIWYTVDEWIDKLDHKLADHFGDEYRELANKRRSRWTRTGTKIFSKL